MRSRSTLFRIRDRTSLAVVERVRSAVQPVVRVHEVQRQGLREIQGFETLESLQIAPSEQVFMAEFIVVGRRQLIESAALGRSQVRSGRALVFRGQIQGQTNG